MAEYTNDLRLKEIDTGNEDGTWGTSTNTNLDLIGDAFGYGTEQFAADANETFTMADGAADGIRGLFLEVTSAGSLTATRTFTIGPNTVSKVWIILNSTTGSQTITIKQGSGSTVDIENGKTKIVYTDGAGAGAAVNEVGLLTDGVIGSTVQAQGAVLDDLNTLGASTADGEFLVATGAGFLAWESGATAAASMFSGTSLTAVTVASNDKVVIQDVSDGNSIKTVTAQDIADLAGGGGGGGGATELDDLTDVTLAAESDAQIMIYDSGSVQWENQTIGGDITINNTGTATLTSDAVVTSNITDDAVTYPKIQNVTATARVLGRNSAGAGVIEELTGSEVLVDIIGTTATASELDYVDVTAGTGAASKALVLDSNGDVTTPGEFTATSYNETYVTFTSSSNACTINCELANHFSHTLTENTTLTLSNPPTSGTAYACVVRIIQDAGASGYSFTWDSAVDWPSATTPTLSSGANDVDFFLLVTYDGGTTWYGFVMGQDVA